MTQVGCCLSRFLSEDHHVRVNQPECVYYDLEGKARFILLFMIKIFLHSHGHRRYHYNLIIIQLRKEVCLKCMYVHFNNDCFKFGYLSLYALYGIDHHSHSPLGQRFKALLRVDIHSCKYRNNILFLNFYDK